MRLQRIRETVRWGGGGDCNLTEKIQINEKEKMCFEREKYQKKLGEKILKIETFHT